MPAVDAEDVRTKADLAAFLDELAVRVHDDPDGIENVALDRFIEAAGAWVSSMDGYFEHRERSLDDVPRWELIASIFAAALIYE